MAIRRKRGRPRSPRYRLTLQFLAYLAASRQPGWMLSLMGGWRNYTSFAPAVHSGVVVAGPLTIERFHRLADALGYPRNQVFLDGPGVEK